ncbi:MAG: LysR family transcriptional regulator [Streptosporangiaceae bacterium]
MDLRRLGHFLAVADHGGFSRASKAVFVSQPALSLSVRELEEELGAELFYRAGRSVRLTPAGKALLGPARQPLRDPAGELIRRAIRGNTAPRVPGPRADPRRAASAEGARRVRAAL